MRTPRLVAGALLLLAAVAGTVTVTGCRYWDDAFADVEVSRGIVYGRAVEQSGRPVDLVLDLYQPAGDTAAARPAIVWVHGGGFTAGTRTNPNTVDLALRFARKGYVTASIDYRLLQGGSCAFAAPTPTCGRAVLDAQHDAQAAVRWVRAHAAGLRVDPDRIAVGGSSAGAITALNVAYRSHDPGDSGTPGVSSAVQAAVSISGTATDVGSIGPGDPPVLLFHGTADATVPYRLAVGTVARAGAAGLVADLVSFEGAGHGLYQVYADAIVPRIAAFLYLVLRAPG
ncbi:MAG: alpha/beta hydrolase [Acidimicrobiales bacterium]|nr:alpha/beta hydrolase [Acidimicrobiales bacterium]